MKKKIILLLLVALTSFSGWAQSITITSIASSVQAGNTLTVNYKYTSTVACKISCGVYLYSEPSGIWTYVSTVVYAEKNSLPAGTNLTGTFNLLIPAGTELTVNLVGTENYKVQPILSNLAGTWLAGAYNVSNYNITAGTAPFVKVTSIPTSVKAGTDLVVNYKYNAASGGKISAIVTKNGGTNAYDYISTVAFVEFNPATAGTYLTGTFTIPIPASTTPTASLTGNENYRVTLELKDASSVYLAGDFSTIDYTITAGTAPYISVTSIPTSTKAGDNLVVNYKYTAAVAGKVSVVVTKNGGVNAYDYISTVGFVELNPASAGTNLMGTFTVPILANITPTASLTGNENYRVTLELKNANDVFLAGDYSTINYNITASLGVNDFDYNKLSVFPNPVDTVLKIANTSDLSNPSFRILNISGQTVQKSKILNDEGINVSGLKTGIYMLSVDSDKKSKQIKFIKK